MVKAEEEGRLRISELLQKRNIDLYGIERIVPSLEDVFLYLLEKDSLQGMALPLGAYRL
jgi:L-lactate utilization protein LutB